MRRACAYGLDMPNPGSSDCLARVLGTETLIAIREPPASACVTASVSKATTSCGITAWA